ncbi:unnamed protein product [Darwinula stevensoni]|uniref:SCP domain-containing protein n=1 Tax=Darwinula stevensoni TaxID=69355 RepID=A0A7R8XD07_9CRUS|nr:unnamed protein product [Darwinula stevensoni]CAG0894232.1 unnamed protein product [Darwinula stevensoni]
MPLCASAQEWANLLAHTNSFRYRNQKDVGENQYCRPLLHPLGDLTGKEVSVYWYSSIRKYDFSKKPDLLHIQAGPFSQLVWAGTKYLGIAKAKTKRSQKVFVVAHYYPPGNATGRFHENVFPLASHQRGKFYDDEGNNLSEAVQPAEAKEEKGKGKGKGDLAYNRWLGKRDTSISSQESSHSS